ncbi:uncharacterized protein LOC111003191 isoform X2 [Pieris rapae]|uniref:uncharacterized protein LOC111003191 isoform X2 n=1 Tax=Pieris rapae TaxID=64459 RepID=UPI001E27C05F|nr:uncharacterized protein LOC111003191 isoform X2 [Pieris rapae]
MGVFKWLRRERVTVTTSHIDNETDDATAEVGTIRTEQYKRDLAEFQARRSLGADHETPKRKSGRHSLPASCTDCAGEPSFNYEKKGQKYKKNKRYTRAYSDEKAYDGVPNIHFLFNNQVFMPGDLFHKGSYSEPKRTSQRQLPEVLKQRRIEFTSEPPLFFKNNALKYDADEFLNSKGVEEVDGIDNRDKDITDDKLCEVMSELNDLDQWADEQLHDNTIRTSRTEDIESDTSTLGLIVASSCNLNIAVDKCKCWSQGKWGIVPVQIKRICGVTMEQVKKKLNMEINILRKCRHPNVILLMGLYPGVNNDVHIVCERFVDSLYGILYNQGRTLSAQTAVHYTLDIANALAFLKMHGYMHTDLHSTCIVVTAHDTAKLADLSPCMKGRKEPRVEKNYDDYSSEPVYVNIEDTQKPTTPESEPLISARSSEFYLKDGVKKNYKTYSDSEFYRWQAPELYNPDEEGFVYPCSKSDVYSLCLVLWECCNGKMPWESYTYERLKEAYVVWQVGLRLPVDGTYPGCLLDLLQKGLRVRRDQRIDLTILQSMLQSVKENLNKMEYIVIPLRTKKSDFSSQWDSTSPAESDCQSPKIIKHGAIVHHHNSTDSSPIYHTLNKVDQVDKICFLSDEELLPAKYGNLEKSYASNCSTPVSKFRERNKEATPDLHRSDSTQYCSILSPRNIELNDQSIKNQSAEAATAKLSRSFTPKSYKPLQITVPEFNLDSIRDIVKKQNSERASYNFDIKNYSLPNTPIARSNKLRKNAWLSGELDVKEKTSEKSQELYDKEKIQDICKENEKETFDDQKHENVRETEIKEKSSDFIIVESPELKKPASPVQECVRDSYTGLKRIPDPPLDFSFPEVDTRPSTWSTRSVQSNLYKVEEEVLANVNVKPLVAIHEKWIHEANKKNVRSFSLPEESRASVRAVKPASHCTDTMQKSLPQLYFKPSSYRPYRASPVSPAASWKSGPFEHYFQSRDSMTKSVTFPIRGNEHKRLDLNKSKSTDDVFEPNEKVDQATDTQNIEDYIRNLICSEIRSLCDVDVSECPNKKTEEFLDKGVTNVVEGLKEDKQTIKSFSKVTVLGNNKPLIRITFNNSERNLQVLDKNVNVVIGENSKEKLNISIGELSTDDHLNQLKRCQAFSAIQEACSTEDLYIDDDISTHWQDNFGGNLKFVPLHGSLHELVCERNDECCLFKIKQENGCDTIYFKSDSDTDVTDGHDRGDRVIFKRSISVVEERIQRVSPRAMRPNPVAALKKLSDKLKSRPKTDILPTINDETRALSKSTPALNSGEKEVEVNIENVMAYQDSSSDECSAENDDFEIIEREIEDEYNASMVCKCLGKISEENLSTMDDNENY